MKAADIVQPGADPNAVCNLLSAGEVNALIGDLTHVPLNDMYVGGPSGPLNSCRWIGTKAVLDVVLIGGDGGAIRRINGKDVTSPEPACNGALGRASGTTAICLFEEMTYWIQFSDPSDDLSGFTPPTEAQLVQLTKDVLARTT